MIVDGFSNPTHILRTCLAHEYAFSYEINGKVIHVAHTKGTWSFGKLQNGELIDYFTWGDSFTEVQSSHELTKSFITSIQLQGKNDKHTILGERDTEARWIEKALYVWAGPSLLIERISVIQPGRNAFVDELSGEFILSPREQDFKS